MIVNLLHNAIVYTPTAGGSGLKLSGNGETVELRVSDSGPGIAPEDRARVFERFVRLDPARGGGARASASPSRAGSSERTADRSSSNKSGPGGSVFLLRLPARPAITGS